MDHRIDIDEIASLSKVTTIARATWPRR